MDSTGFFGRHAWGSYRTDRTAPDTGSPGAQENSFARGLLSVSGFFGGIWTGNAGNLPVAHASPGFLETSPEYFSGGSCACLHGNPALHVFNIKGE